RHDNLILVHEGIELTPFLSILQEIGFKLNNGRNRYPAQKFLYTVKTSQEIFSLDPILPRLLDIE
ncbi:ferric reduction oxidase 8, mitochondrial isoform X2, partial [Olea europaea subsp. europaea]